MRRRAALALLLLGLAAAAAAQAPGAGPSALAEALPGVRDAAQLIGPPAGPRLAGAALDAETKRVGALLRCPVCQGLSVADSPATMAVNMRHQVGELLAAGYTEDQILSYFERSYGEFVRLQPPLRGVNWTLWLAPIVGLLAGGAIIGWMLRRPAAPPASVAEPGVVPAEDPLPEDPELAGAVLRVREMAYGWPGGVRPGKGRS